MLSSLTMVDCKIFNTIYRSFHHFSLCEWWQTEQWGDLKRSTNPFLCLSIEERGSGTSSEVRGDFFPVNVAVRWQYKKMARKDNYNPNSVWIFQISWPRSFFLHKSNQKLSLVTNLVLRLVNFFYHWFLRYFSWKKNLLLLLLWSIKPFDL